MKERADVKRVLDGKQQAMAKLHKSTSVSGRGDCLVVRVENLFYFHHSIYLDYRTCKQEGCPRYRTFKRHGSIHLTKRHIRALQPRPPMSLSIPVAIKNQEHTSRFPFMDLSSLTVNYARPDVHIRPLMARLGR